MGVSVSVGEVCPARPFQVVPPSVESCHWVVGAGLPEQPTVKEAGLGAVTVSGVGWVVTCGDALIVTDWAVWALGPPLRLTVCPVKVWVVDVPAVSVSVSVTV